LISLSNPAAPKRLARLDTDGYARAIAAAGRWAFVADGQAGLLILDITNPEAPRIVGGHPTGGSTYAVNVSGQLVYVLDDWAGGVSVFDVSNPAEPAWVSRIPAKPERSIPRAVAVAGAYACVAGGFGVELWELSDPTHPRRIGGNSVLYGLYHRPLIAGGRIYVPLADVCCDGLAVLESLPFLKRIVRSPGQVRLDWEGWGRARLQSTTTLSPPDWQDLGVPETVNTLTLPADNGTQFFRLHQP
jgi:hypothetical protein